MKLFIKILLFNTIILFAFFTNINPSLTIKNKSATIQLKTGSTFTLESNISDYIGKIIKEENATLAGNNISFSNGIFEDNGNKINLKGQLTNSSLNKIILDGNKYLRCKKGEILQSLQISGQNNKIEGNLVSSGDTIIQDENTTVIFAILNKLSHNIQLNNGQIHLEEDLKFIEGKKLIGPGNISCQKRKVIFEGDSTTISEPLKFCDDSHIELNTNMHLTTTLTFCNGSSHIMDGQGSILYLETGGKLAIEDNATLMLKNITINGIQDTNIACLGSNSKLIIQNVTLILSNNFSFQTGSFELQDYVEFLGAYSFAYHTDQTSTIKKSSFVVLDKHVTFSYDPTIASKTLISFEDIDSCLIIENASFHTTTTGIILTKGCLFINNDAHFSSEKEIYMQELTIDEEGTLVTDGTNPIVIEGGITFGNENSNDDLYIEIANTGELELTSGTINYKNINATSLTLLGERSHITIRNNCTLNLYQSMNLGSGHIKFYANATLARASGAELIGAILSVGKYYQTDL